MVTVDVVRTPGTKEVALRRKLGYTHVLKGKSGTALAWAHSENWAFDLVRRLEKAGSVSRDDIFIVPLQ
jgi:acetyl-CoA carboxylase carboxyltransferase component